MHSKQTDLIFRVVGLIVFASAGIALSTQLRQFPLVPETIHLYLTIATGIICAVIGWLTTPRLIVRPLSRLRKAVQQMPTHTLVSATLGLFVGLALGAIAAYPISLLPQPLGQFLPFIVAVAFGYAGVATVLTRPDLIQAFRSRFSPKGETNATTETLETIKPRSILLDTSVIIDGRIADICKTGFIHGELVVPLFVLSELQHVADSSDTLRRNRGRRGLEILRQLQDDSPIPVRLLDVDIPEIREVDDKLIALAKDLGAAILTNDYNLNRVAELQSVQVLNVNELANAVKTILLPGERFSVHVLQEGKEYNQGVGYLDDGTMVVVEDGLEHIGHTIEVTVTKVLQTAAGRMIFARPEDSSS